MIRLNQFEKHRKLQIA